MCVVSSALPNSHLAGYPTADKHLLAVRLSVTMYAVIKRMCTRLLPLCVLVLLFITVANLYSTTTKAGFRPRVESISEVRVQSEEDLGSLSVDLYKVGVHVPLNNHVPIHQGTTTYRELQVSRPEKLDPHKDQNGTTPLKEHLSVVSIATAIEQTDTKLNRQTDSMTQPFSPVPHQEGIAVDKLGNLVPREHKYTYQSTASAQQTVWETQALRTGDTTDETAEIARKEYPSVIAVPKDAGRKQVLPAIQKISAPTLAPQQQESFPDGHRAAGGGKGGYVLAEDFWEQQMSGSRNLQDLQCWAGLLGLRVVEPFVINSVLKTRLNVKMKGLYRHFLRFHDLLDLGYWNSHSKALHHAELVSWEEFLQHAPRDAIMVDIKYKTQGELEPVSNQLPRSQRYKVGCKNVETWSKEAAFLQQTQFNLTRMVCFNFQYGDMLSMEEFNQHIFAGHSPQNVTVIFQTWRGLRSSGRVTVGGSLCPKPHMHLYVPLSPKVTQMTEVYKTKYLNGSDYIAVMARIEKAKIYFRREGIVTYCLNQIIQYVNTLRVTSGIEQVFLSIDMGKFGSNSFRDAGDSTDLDVEFTKFFAKLYSNTMTISQWSNTFTDTASTSDAGYIAVLQKSIAIHAKCVIFVGGGLFQNHAVQLYKKLHPRSEQQCITTITDCTRDKYS